MGPVSDSLCRLYVSGRFRIMCYAIFIILLMDKERGSVYVTVLE